MKHPVFGLIALVFIAGCGQEQLTTYEVPKEQPAVPPPQTASEQNDASVIAAHTAMNAQAPSTGYTAELPEGWTEQGSSGMRMASYTIDETSIDFYLTSLTMGDVPSNVNRWRGQVGLPAASPEQIASEIQTFEADGRAVSYIEIYNEEGGKGIIAAIVDLSPKYWYFTGKGSVDELKAHTGEVRAFLESIQFR
mgnify:CR=1 FL=1